MSARRSLTSFEVMTNLAAYDNLLWLLWQQPDSSTHKYLLAPLPCFFWNIKGSGRRVWSSGDGQELERPRFLERLDN